MFYVCSKNGVPVDIKNEFIDCENDLNFGEFDQINAFDKFDDVVLFLAAKCSPAPQPAVDPQPAAQPAEVVFWGDGLDHPLYLLVKEEFKKIFGDQFKPFFVKIQQELRQNPTRTQ